MCTNPKIIIIGAGTAGYAAACRLLEHGFTNLQILEAENRIGGRICSIEFGASMVDLGAQWCHGIKDNIVYKLAKDTNTLQHPSVDYSQFKLIDSKGEFVDSDVSKRLIKLLFSISDDYSQLVLQSGSLGEYVTNKFTEMLKTAEYSDINHILARRILNWFEKIQNNIISSPNWCNVSAKGLATYINCEGCLSLCWNGTGYKTLFSLLNREILNPSHKLAVSDKILLNKVVIRIFEEDNKSVCIECLDGSKYNADHAIVTMPLGVLKETFESMFVPKLPLFKQNAIEGLAIGTVDKILLKFPKKWWSDDCMRFDLIWNEEDSQTFLTNFPEGPTNNNKSWLEFIYSFQAIDNNPTILLGWINGELVREYESLSDDVVLRGCMFLLRTFLGKHYDIPDPESILRSAWYSNKHFRGSYSYRSMVSDALNTTAADLAKPIWNNTLLFAGEATHSCYYSTVHGAVESGFREAQRIINLHN